MLTKASTKPVLSLLAACVLAVIAPAGASADKIKNPTAIFAGLDKITGRIISFEVAIDETVQFGSLQITPRVCFTRPPTEAPHTTSFVEVEEVLDNKKFKKIFAGWMFSASPGLHGVEHPVYDAWLTGCKGGTEIIKTAKPKDDDDHLAKEALRGAKSRPQRERTARSPRETRPRPPRRQPTRQFYPQRRRSAVEINRERRGVNPFGNY